jgi:uncharacterized membrane protein HdeD (DUF308 family)
MSLSMRFTERHLSSFGEHWLRFLVWGIALTVIGLFAIYASTFATLLTVVILGFVVFFGGSIMFVDTLTFWWGKWSSFLFHLIVALLYLAVGIILIMNPLEGSISLTLLLGIFYLVIGLFRMFNSSSTKTPQWGWALFNGLINFALGVLILASWPSSSLFIIGLFVGIDLVFVGWSYIMAALAGRAIANKLGR